jgi:molybdate transport system permease protein
MNSSELISGETLTAIGLTFKLASATTILLLLLATPLAWWLARTRSPWQAPILALTTLPLILPPTVLGFYLLMALGPQGPLGQFTALLGLNSLSFSFTGLLIGSIIYSLPFAVQPLQQAFETLGTRPLEVAATLGATPRDRFFSIILPMTRQGFITAAVLCFAHTVGEFGVVLMIGGNIPDQTRVVSTALYSFVEAAHYPQAHALALLLLLFSFSVLLTLNITQRRTMRVAP